jgi:thiamine-phosphate pyrophosphorylase
VYASDPIRVKLLRGIYPVLNVTPETDADALLDWAVQLPDAGIRLVQVRAKQFPDETLPTVLDNITSMLRGAGLAVILNDYVELVGITGADGVHLGVNDFPVPDARKILGPGAIIGATCRNPEQALTAVGQGASYVAAGSIFESKTKGGLPVMGIGGLKEIASRLSDPGVVRTGQTLPVCAIGGITVERLRDVHAAGASMAAMVDAIQGADDPVAAAFDLTREWDRLEWERTPGIVS